MADGAADGAVQFLLQSLTRVLEEHLHLIARGGAQVKNLGNKLHYLKATLEDHAKNTRRQKATSREVKRQIRSAVYEIEDAIDNFVAQMSNINKYSNRVVRFIAKAKLHDVSKKVDYITNEVEHIMNLAHEAGESGPNLEEMIKSPRVDRDSAMVGFEQELERIVYRLCWEAKEELDVISIVGMAGVGKTTLAYKVFTHREVETLYDEAHRIWVNVSREYRKKEVLLSILSHFTEVTDRTQCKDEHGISEIVRAQLLMLDKFLIVMDGVWSADVWMDLKGTFPKAHKTGKILITTQLEEIPHYSDITRVPLGQLSPDESWELLQSEVFGSSICPPELKARGELIAEKCSGLPLLIVMIGKFLKRNCLQGGLVHEQGVWEEVSSSDSVSSYLDEEELENIDTSFYDDLPYHLKPCFLYMGIFPEVFEIPVRMLFRLWIAEGFTAQKKTARKYLHDLISRNLVMIGKTGPDGHIKTCRIHCLLRVFCIKEAGSKGQNMFQEMKYMGKNKFEPPISNLEDHRRLCLNSHVNEFFNSGPSCPRVHSLVCFSKDHLQPANVSTIPKVLTYLRVLDFNLITFKILPQCWNKLALLKCIVLTIDFGVIPKVISKFRNMQTLIVYTTSPTLEIKANIWKMSNLKYVETNVSTTLPTPKKGKGGNNKLDTLGMISYQSCTKDVFDQLESLRKLGIHGMANELDKLCELEKLKLVNDSVGALQQRQNQYKFPPNLKSLTLCATHLDWSHMATLGQLTNLKVLKLKHNAFRGNTWEDPGFPELLALHIVDNELVTWTVPVNSFPKLLCLMLSNCRGLEAIPVSLGESLKILELKGHFMESLMDSVRNIQEVKNALPLERREFKLCIA